MAILTPTMLEQLALQPLDYQRTIWEARVKDLWSSLQLELMTGHEDQAQLLLQELKTYLDSPVCREVLFKMRLAGENEILSKVVALVEEL